MYCELRSNEFRAPETRGLSFIPAERIPVFYLVYFGDIEALSPDMREIFIGVIW